MIVTTNPHLENSVQEERIRAKRSKLRGSLFSLLLLLQPRTPKALRWLHRGMSVFTLLRSPDRMPWG